MVKNIILYGAFDRYNYGDNLMPLLLEKFILSNYVETSNQFEFIYASINSSDLSHYSCKPTVPMKSLLHNNCDFTVIVVGGEVMGADVGTLYTHVQKNIIFSKVIRVFKRLSPQLINTVSKLFYPAVWDYPYIPRKSSFKGNVKVIYNTVGGIPIQTQWEYVREADYISVRDQRSFNGVKEFCSAHLVPDSVLIASKLIDHSFFLKNVRNHIIELCKSKKFITVQACPYKVKFTAKEMAAVLDKVKKDKPLDIILLPIGYASGHDDLIFMEEVKKCSSENLELIYDLNVWEIMYIISKSSAFYGTSLHGVITAMSFSIPHFCINADIKKLTSFLKTWSIYPFQEPLDIKQLYDSIDKIIEYDNSELINSVENTQQLIISSLKEIVSKIN
ncbi:polysaccharide pyruvyl transferase family protein [Raoultella terrigena]|uniref:polysaccharide pyruvyl transferase family protein n=1 Tax=Raoultella terrigena TaxID=577 RepID=UPI00385118B7